MVNYEVKDIRNFAFIGHGNAGKTSLVEALLYKAGATSRLGEVEDGTTVCDFEPDEQERQNSFNNAIVYCNWKNKALNILDTPGYPDFVSEAISALAAVETVFLTVNASAGIMVNTRKMWEHATKRNLARVIVLTKLDAENIKFTQFIDSLKETFGEQCLPLTLPIGGGNSLKDVVNLLDTPPDKFPEEIKAEARKAREKLIESIVEVNDELLNKYLDGAEITQSELETTFIQAILKGKVTPILVTSVKKQIGIRGFLDFVAKYLPSPQDVGAKKGIDPSRKVETANPEESPAEISRDPQPASPFSAQVFKCTTDPFVGKLAYFRVFSGSLSADSSFYNTRTRKNERFGKIFKVFGKEQRSVEKAICGDIIAVTKIENIAVSDTLCIANQSIKYPEIQFPQPMVSLSVEPKSKSDEQRLSSALSRVSDSDPGFKVTRDRQTTELVITGMSNLHIDITLNRLKRKFDVGVNTKQPRIPYKETVTSLAEAQHKHKKQTGGHGQYGEVYLRLKPLPRGEGFNFVDEIFGGAIPNQYIPAVEKGIKEVLNKGVIAGYPVVDLEVVLYDGSYHDVDSSEAAFKIAASKAFQQAVKNAKAVLLEPIVNIEITIPTKYMGDITGDLNSRRGRITGMDTTSNQQIIKATVPLAEVATYSTELRSITGGEGHYAMDFSHYDIVPHKIQETVVSRAKVVKEED